MGLFNGVVVGDNSPSRYGRGFPTRDGATALEPRA